MKNRFTTVAILALLFILLAIFWGIVGNYLLPKKSTSQNKEAVNYLKDIIPILVVSNVNESIIFYKDVLGFEENKSDIKKGKITYLQRGSVIIGLSQNYKSINDYSMNKTKIIIVVDNIENIYKSITENHNTINHIKEELNSKKSFAIVDYDSNILVFQEKETD